jgi:hypothetical protein
MDFLNALNIFGSDLGWVGGVIALVAGGALAPAVVTVLVNLLRLPGLRQLVVGSCFSAGKLLSTLATKRLGKYGRQLEDGMQEIKNLANEAFDRGLDHDDKK